MVGNIENISPAQIDIYIEQKKNAIIVDVRKEKKYGKRHIKGAVNITYEDILAGKHDLPGDMEIILYCDRGGMSMMAAKYLISKGYKVKNMVGGINNYRGKNIVQ